MLTHESTDDYVLTISDEGMRRAENDNALLRNIPKPMTKRMAIFTGASLGLVACVVMMFVGEGYATWL